MCYHSSVENNKAHEISGTYHKDRTFKIKIKEDNKMTVLQAIAFSITLTWSLITLNYILFGGNDK
ncbi:hypothetical protein [Lactococcus phage PLG-II]|nr:hypothetical protein [Lactococcus phage PLG-II]